MRPINDKTIAIIEDVAVAGARQIKRFFSYNGKNPSPFSKAKLGAGVISSYSRILATETSREALKASAAAREAVRKGR